MNEDDCYDLWRERWIDKLEDDIEKLIIKFTKDGYYSSSDIRFIKHIIAFLEIKLNCKIEFKILKKIK